MSDELKLFSTEPEKKESGFRLLINLGIKKLKYKSPSISIQDEIPEAKKYDTQIKSKPLNNDKSLF